MKLALVLYGQPRNYKEGHQVIQTFLEQQGSCKVDIFYHTWTLETAGEQFEASPWRPLSKESLTFQEGLLDELHTLYRPLKWLAEPSLKAVDESLYTSTIAYRNIQANERKRGNIKNVISQMVSRTKARNLLANHIQESGVQYDFVLMMRFDIKEVPKALRLADLDKRKVYVSNAHLPRRVFPDNFIICPPKIFCKWMAIMDDLPAILNSSELQRQMAGLKEKLELNPEEILLGAYLYHFGSLQNLVLHPAIKCGI
jgi:hypothetical protein